MDISQYSEEYLEEYSGYDLLAASIAFIVINTLAFLLRLVARRFQNSKIGWHDGLILAAYIVNIGLCADAIVALRWGVGYHQPRLFYYENWKLPFLYRNTFYAALILYYFGSALPKLSVLALYLKIFTSRFVRICCYILIGILVGYVVAGCFVIGFQCPTQLESDSGELPEDQIARCVDIKAFYAYFGLPNIVTDLAIMLLPLPSIAKLHQALHVRIGLITTFIIASGGMIVAIVRFIVFYKHQWTGREAFSDASWSTVKLAIITLLECCVYFVCACLLCSRPVLSKMVNSATWERLISWTVSLTHRSSSRSGEKDGTWENGIKRDSLRKVKGRSGIAYIESLQPVSRFEPDFGDIESRLPAEPLPALPKESAERSFLDLREDDGSDGSTLTPGKN